MAIPSLLLLEAFRRARQRALGHMLDAEQAGFAWGEETVTELLLVAAGPEVRAFPFNKRQEGGNNGTGADWLWWWIGDEGVSFGTLIQAKRLKKKPDGGWDLDFDYNGGKQWASLMSAARALQVAPTYALYMGSPRYRHPVACTAPHHPEDFMLCDLCISKTVSLLPALLLAPGSALGSDSAWAYELAAPLEDLVDPHRHVAAMPFYPHLELSPDLVRFLFSAQTGPKRVAKELVEQIRRVRAGQFGLATADPVEVSSEDYAFPTLPDDRLHVGEPYFPNILRGLRNSPPDYVLELLAKDDPEPVSELTLGLDDVSLAGVVILDQRGR